MEEWEIPNEVDDFESRYADELDLLEEFDKEGKILLQTTGVPLEVENTLTSAYISEYSIISG